MSVSSFPPTDGTPLIQLDAATKSFTPRGGQTFHALRGISLSVPAGDFLAVLGKSGSGKSTLLNLIAGLDRPTSGEVHAAGVDLSRLSESKLALWRGSNLGVVFQFFQLLPTLTVSENILIAMDFVAKIPAPQRRIRARDLLKMVGLGDQSAKLPSALSGGQQQRAAIARALANDPPIVLADEPTGNLDSETAGAVAELFHALIDQGKTLLIVTHDENLARRADRVIQLKDGAIVMDERKNAARA
ncbi:MAG TPA: ABC transporter ATP-binding protein [Chthoniobacterales bacterium]|nr:ABC transporter ATP-binding protein [Chthoniobacterales bacterium]